MTLQRRPHLNTLPFLVVLLSQVILALVSCHTKPEVNIQSRQGLTLIDSTALEEDAELMPFDSTDRMAFYPVYYLGEAADTIALGHHPVSMFYNEKRDGKYDAARNWAAYTDRNMSIRVDTSLLLAYKRYFAHLEDKTGNEIVDSAKYYKAFPVFIINHSDSLLMPGSHNLVSKMIREAMDEDGRWVEVEEKVSFFCGTAKRDLVVDPKTILIAKLLRYRGDTTVKFRLKFEFLNQGVYSRIYSNTFTDYFDKAQLRALALSRFAAHNPKLKSNF
jgi:hypothetical protein